MAEDQISSTKILYTLDYDLFKIMEGNRSIVPRKIKKLRDSIENGLDLLRYCPIIVNEKMEVIDGQHRLEVSRELGRPVFYVMALNEMHIKQVAEMNCNTDKWKSMDYIECFIKQDNDNYKTLLALINKYNFTPSCASSLLMKGVVHEGGHTMLHVKSGTFKVKFEEMVNSFLTWLKPINEFAENPKSRDYIGGMLLLQESDSFNIEHFISKLNESGLKISHQLNKKAYLSHIEDIYNYKKKTRVRIY